MKAPVGINQLLQNDCEVVYDENVRKIFCLFAAKLIFIFVLFLFAFLNFPVGAHAQIAVITQSQIPKIIRSNNIQLTIILTSTVKDTFSKNTEYLFKFWRPGSNTNNLSASVNPGKLHYTFMTLKTEFISGSEIRSTFKTSSNHDQTTEGEWTFKVYENSTQNPILYPKNIGGTDGHFTAYPEGEGDRQPVFVFPSAVEANTKQTLKIKNIVPGQDYVVYFDDNNHDPFQNGEFKDISDEIDISTQDPLATFFGNTEGGSSLPPPDIVKVAKITLSADEIGKTERTRRICLNLGKARGLPGLLGGFQITGLKCEYPLPPFLFRVLTHTNFINEFPDGKAPILGDDDPGILSEHGETTFVVVPPPCAIFENDKCIAVNTAIGEISTEPAGFVKSIFSIVLGLSGGIALILIIIAGYRLMASHGNPEAVQAARDQLISAIVGLLFIIFSFVILQVIGVDILKIPGFTK